MSKLRKKWSLQEDEFLKKEYKNNKSIKEIVEHLGRSNAAVRQRARYLGLSQNRPTQKQMILSKEQLEIIGDNKYSAREAAKKANVSETTVRNRRNELFSDINFVKSNKWTNEEIELVKSQQYTLDELVELINHSKNAIRQKFYGQISFAEKSKRWTNDDDNIIKSQKYNIKELCEKLNRTENSIRNRIHFLDIHDYSKKYKENKEEIK